MTEFELPLPRMLHGRYRLEAKLGQGGMGIVYRGIDLLIERTVAVKLIRGEDDIQLDEEVAGRFLREAKNTARIQNEHIIEVYDLGRSDTGEMYFVMELVDGESLSARLKREIRLPMKEAVYVAMQVCEALAVAHDAGIIHRDLKPANVMLQRRPGDDLFVKVLDFGVAKSTSPDQQTQLTRTGMLVGTVEYMAPEQIIGRRVDARTDIYSLGVMMYKMLSGGALFRETGVPALIQSHLNRAPEPLRERAPQAAVTESIDKVVLRCLAKRPEERFQTMRDVMHALRQALDHDLTSLPSLEYDVTDPYAVRDRTGLLGDDPGDGIDETRTHVMRPSNSRVGERTAPPSIRTEVVQARPMHAPRICMRCARENPPFARACSSCGAVLIDTASGIAVAPPHAHSPSQGSFSSSAHTPITGTSASGTPITGTPITGTPITGTPITGVSGVTDARRSTVWQRVLAWAGLRR